MSVVLDRSMLEGARWSMAAKCARMCALHLNGEMPDLPDDETLGYMERGLLYEVYAYGQLISLYDEVERQPEIPWPFGMIHGDFYIPSERMIVEHKSRTSLDDEDSDWLQLAGQVMFHPLAVTGELWITDPVNPRRQRRLPFTLTQEWRERVGHVVDLIGQRNERLPDRICAHPAEARSHLCLFPLPCFDDWQPSEPLTLPKDVSGLAEELYRLETRRMTVGPIEQAEIEEERAKVRAMIAPWLLNGADYQIPVNGGQIRIRRTVSEPGVTYDVKAAIAAGQLKATGRLARFAKPRKGAERWTITAIGDPDMDNQEPF